MVNNYTINIDLMMIFELIGLIADVFNIFKII